MNKYKNNKVTYEGITFDSTMERDFYIFLLQRYEKEEIIIQPKFELQEKFWDREGNTIRAITYTADFQAGSIVYDVKGMMTQQGEMRVKMFKYKHKHLYLKVVTKAPKYSGKEWIEINELKKIRKERKKYVQYMQV